MNKPTLQQDSNAVLLPAFDGISLSQEVQLFLKNGGRSILIGESRAEYLNREMSDERKQSESEETFKSIIGTAKKAIQNAVITGKIKREQLEKSANKVRNLAIKYQ